MTKTELTKIGLAKSVQPFRSYEDIHTQTQTLLLCSIDFIKYESSYDLINQRNLKKFVLFTYMRWDIRYSCLKHQIFSDSNQDKSDEWKEIFGLHLNRESEKWKVIFGLGYTSGTISKMTACDRDLSFLSLWLWIEIFLPNNYVPW